MLFGAPFLLAGLLTMAAAFRQWSLPNPQEDWLPVLLVGLTFAGAGAGVMASGWISRRKMLERAALQRQYPGQPWMWRSDWARGRVESDFRSTMIVAWVIAGFTGGITWATLAATWDKIPTMGPPGLGIALLPVICLVVASWAVVATSRHRKYGASIFELSTLPGVVGGRLAGRIETKLPEIPSAGARLHLDCIRIVRSGKSTTRRLLWKVEEDVPASRLSRGWQGVSIPVSLQIPADAQPTVDGSGRVLWRLSAHVSTPGVDFKANFEAPVYRTAQSAPDDAFDDDEDLSADAVSGLQPGVAAPPAGARFTQRASPGGGVELYCPPPLNRLAAAGAAVFLAAWLAALAALILFGAPWFMTIPWGLAGCLIGVAVVAAAFGETVIRIEGEELFVSRGVLTFRETRSLRAHEVAQVKVVVGWTQSQTMTQASRAFWDVKVVPKVGGDVAVARNLPKRAEADWLAGELRGRLGIPEPEKKKRRS
jgi:hypothetical protein